MVAVAVKHKSGDEDNKQRIESKNGLENYAYSLCNSLNGEKLKEEIPEVDKKAVDNKETEVIQWLGANQSSEKEEYDSKQKELEVRPIRYCRRLRALALQTACVCSPTYLRVLVS
ncbi:Heat shock protein [Phytophthora citrophthora]|uniref:Heat shock protein n=1 Tax=Phytophthora citrophthora TaxID=4793 RepID=A0AAD9LBP1_9STRA|nr:Heat shock protein [Phytophthora citrophthora]